MIVPVSVASRSALTRLIACGPLTSRIVARVESQSANAAAKAGVMFRNTSAANSVFADVVAKGGVVRAELKITTDRGASLLALEIFREPQTTHFITS